MLRFGFLDELVEAVLQKGYGERVGELQALQVLDLVGDVLLQQWEGIHGCVVIFLQTRVCGRCTFFAPQGNLQRIDCVGERGEVVRLGTRLGVSCGRVCGCHPACPWSLA